MYYVPPRARKLHNYFWMRSVASTVVEAYYFVRNKVMTTPSNYFQSGSPIRFRLRCFYMTSLSHLGCYKMGRHLEIGPGRNSSLGAQLLFSVTGQKWSIRSIDPSSTYLFLYSGSYLFEVPWKDARIRGCRRSPWVRWPNFAKTPGYFRYHCACIWYPLVLWANFLKTSFLCRYLVGDLSYPCLRGGERRLRGELFSIPKWCQVVELADSGEIWDMRELNCDAFIWFCSPMSCCRSLAVKFKFWGIWGVAGAGVLIVLSYIRLCNLPNNSQYLRTKILGRLWYLA